MSDFNKILRQQCSIELQTNCKVSVKSVNNCKVIVVLVRALKNLSVHYKGNDAGN